MLYSRKKIETELGIEEEVPKEELSYSYSNKTEDGKITLAGKVTDADGTVLFVSSYVQGNDTMRVTDLRTDEVKDEPISYSRTLAEIADDMRELGYITENQVLVWA